MVLDNNLTGEKMDEILEIATSAGWWISVVVMGLIVNIVAAYLKPFFDKLYSGFSRSKAQKLEQQSLEKLKRIALLKADSHAQLISSFKALRLRNQALEQLITSFWTLTLSIAGLAYLIFRFQIIDTILAIPIGIVFFLCTVNAIFSFGNKREAIKIEKELYEASEEQA
jgi:hypothetical protein